MLDWNCCIHTNEHSPIMDHGRQNYILIAVSVMEEIICSHVVIGTNSRVLWR